MNREADFDDPVPLVVSHSISSTFDSCARRFEFQHVYGVVGRGDYGFAADVGSALHEAVQAWARVWLHPSSPRDSETQEQALNAGLFALMLHWPWVLEDIEFAAGSQVSTVRSFEKSLLLFYATIESPWWSAWELALDHDGEPCIEIAWRINHASMPTFMDHRSRNRNLVSQGKIDFVLRHRKTGSYRVVDLKSTVKSPKAVEAAFRFSGQGVGYAKVLGAVLGIPWREEGLTVTYLAMLFGNQSTLPELPIPLNFYYDPEEIEDMLRNEDDRLRRISSYGKQGWWPRTTNGCESFGTVCHFFDVCGRRDSEFIDRWLSFSNDFEERSRIYDPKWILEA